jgi:VWA domain-containing protein
MPNALIPTVSRHPLRSAQLLIGAFLLAGVFPLCFGQANGTDVHITPRSIRTSARSEVQPRNGVTERFNSHASLVLVPVTVTDKKDHLVIGLERDNFSIFDGQERQVIRNLSNEDAPISLGIIFDTSSSMYGKIERSTQAVVQFLRTANPSDEFFLIGFADRPELLVDFTSSAEDIQDGISRVTPEGRTALLDAVYLGLDTMRRARNERKVLLIVSDGGENHSRYNIKDVWSVVEEAGNAVRSSRNSQAPRSVKSNHPCSVGSQCTDAIRVSRTAVSVYEKTMVFLFEFYGPSSPMILVNPGSSAHAGFESGGGNVCDAGSDRAVHSECRILCAIFGCAMQGVQAPRHWLLGASTT